MNGDKIVLGICIFLFFSVTVSAQIAPVDPISRTDKIIQAEHEKTRAWCQEQWQLTHQQLGEQILEEKDNYVEQQKQVLWIDRVASFVSLFFAMFFGITLKSLFDLQRRRKWETIQKQKEQYENVPIPKPPKKRWRLKKRYSRGVKK